MMTKSTTRYVLRFAPKPEFNNEGMAHLTAVEGQVNLQIIQQMQNELLAYFANRGQSLDEVEYTFKCVPETMPRRWRLIPLDHGGKRGIFLELKPVGQADSPSTRSVMSPECGSVDHGITKSSVGQGIATAVAASVPKQPPRELSDASCSTGECVTSATATRDRQTESLDTPADSDSVPAVPGSAQKPMNKSSPTTADTDSRMAAEPAPPSPGPIPRWQQEFVASVRSTLEAVPRSDQQHESERLIPFETLTDVERLIGRHSEHMALILYHGLILAMYREAADDGRDNDQYRLQIMLNQIDRICCDAFIRQIERNHDQDKSARPTPPTDRGWVIKLLGYLLSSLRNCRS